jgi:hypothetical protein
MLDRQANRQEGNMMHEASRWRFDLAREIGSAYAANPKAKVIMVAGSTGRGTADRYSDLELDVYYSEAPTVAERKAAVAAAGGELLDYNAEAEEDEWAEEISFGGFHVGTSTFLVETMDRYITEVVDRHGTDPLAQMRLYSLLHAQTLVGEETVRRWRKRASTYPTGLVHAMLGENLVFDGFGYAEEMFAARDDLLALYDIFCLVERQVLGALLGLNRIYLPNPSFKSMDELIAEMHLTPPDLTARLKAAFRLPPEDGVRQLHSVIEDVFRLVEAHVPGFDTREYRRKVSHRRGVWDHAPGL